MTCSLSKFADEFAQAAKDAENPEQRDAYLILEARSNGEPVPSDAARRVINRVRAEK